MATFRPSGISINIREDLVSGASRSQTTLIVDPIITKDGRRVTIADIGDICFAKIDEGTSNEEIISFTGITDNTSTYTLTGCVWGYNFYNGTGSVAANIKKHNSGASFIISDDDHFLALQYVNVDGTQTISGAKTFSTLPQISAGNPINDNDVARKAYVDSVVAGSFPANRIVVAGTAGATIADGNLVYFDTTDDKWKLCDADTAATVENVLLGIAQGAGTTGNAITNGVLLEGLDDAQSGMTIGDVMYAGNTAGAISASAGTTEVVIGIAKSATELYFAPGFKYFLTKNQQDALNTTTALGSTNKLITQKDFQKGAEIYAADAEASDTYVITLSPAPAAYTTGMVINFKANTANTGAATLNVNSLGAKTIVKGVNTTLANNDIAASQLCKVIYDGTNFVLLNPNYPVSVAVSSVGNASVSGTNVLTTQNIDTAIATTFTPKIITVDFYLKGFSGSGSATYTVGKAIFDGSTIKSVFYLINNQTATTISASTIQVGDTSPTAGGDGSNGGWTMSIQSVSATGFTFRLTYTQGSTWNGGDYKATVSATA